MDCVQMRSQHFDKRAISVGGYGTLVPFHGMTTFDPATKGDPVLIRLPVSDGWGSVHEVLSFIERAENLIGAKTSQGQLYYSYQCSEFGFHSSGLNQLETDIRNSFELADELQGTFEDRYNREFRKHRPCFIILAPAEYGTLVLLLRGGKSSSDGDGSDCKISYDARASVLMSNQVVSWPNLEELIDIDHGGPITQQQTELNTVRIGDKEQELEEVYPLDQEVTGDADIIAARNPFNNQSLQTEAEDIKEAVQNTQHLTFRVRGGTIGFDKEEKYTLKSMTVYQPEALSYWGFPVAFSSPICNAYPAD